MMKRAGVERFTGWVRRAARCALLTAALWGLSLPPAAAAPAPPDPQALLEAAALRYGAASVQRLRLVTEGRAREKTRDLVLYTRRDGGTLRVRGELLAPEALLGTRFVVIDGEGAPEVLIFLPALGAVTPLRGERRTEGFLGTDLSLSELSPPEPGEGEHRLIEEDEEGWLVETVPAPGTSDYQRIRAWISKADALPRRVEYFREGAAPVKRLEVLELDVQGLPSRLRMTDLSRSTSTLLEIVEQRSDLSVEAIPLELFTADSLKSTYTADLLR